MSKEKNGLGSETSINPTTQFWYISSAGLGESFVVLFLTWSQATLPLNYGGQRWNRVTITDPDDPLTRIVIKVEACAEKYVRWFYAQLVGFVLQRIINSWDKYADCVASYNLQAKDLPQSWTAPTLSFLSHSSKCSHHQWPVFKQLVEIHLHRHCRTRLSRRFPFQWWRY